MPITLSEDFSSCNSDNKLFIPNSQLNSNDGCSSVVECTVVVRETRVRFSASIYFLFSSAIFQEKTSLCA